jgi:hypothetical protein
MAGRFYIKINLNPYHIYFINIKKPPPQSTLNYKLKLYNQLHL